MKKIKKFLINIAIFALGAHMFLIGLQDFNFTNIIISLFLVWFSIRKYIK